jgi:quercetin dioxygenase-like cupin family protein
MTTKMVSIEQDDPAQVLKPGLKRRLIHLENLMTVVVDFSEPMSEPDPPHAHPHEQITYVAEGHLWFFVGDEKFELNRGDMICIPSGVLHTVQTLSPDVRLIDSFSPVRNDFL